MGFKKYLNQYELQVKLPGSGEQIKYRPMNLGQMKNLLTHVQSNNSDHVENAIDSLISECIINEGYDIHKMYLEDRYFILVELRKASKGSKYEVQLTCDAMKKVKNEDGEEVEVPCNSQFINIVDLSNFEVKVLSNNVDRNVKLNKNISIELRHNTRKDQIEIETLMNEKKYSNDMAKAADQTLLLSAAGISSITTPDGKEKDLLLEDKLLLINSLTESEYEKIIKWREKYSFGLEFKMKIKCPHCGNEKERVFGLADFFG